jgi:hypothetical protein
MTDLERGLLVLVPKILRTDEGIGEAIIRAYASEACALAEMLRAKRPLWTPDSQAVLEKAAVAMEKRAESLRKIAERWPSTLRMSKQPTAPVQAMSRPKSGATG